MLGREEASCSFIAPSSNFIFKWLDNWPTYFREGRQIREMASHRELSERYMASHVRSFGSQRLADGLSCCLKYQ